MSFPLHATFEEEMLHRHGRPGGPSRAPLRREGYEQWVPPAKNAASAYNRKRKLDETPEPAAKFRGDVDPGRARPGPRFVIHQHHASSLHWDLRLEMLNGRTPVLVSWAVPKGMPRDKGKPTLAIHVEDHPFDYGTFEGTIPKGNYGAGAVRIFDEGTYEMIEQKDGNLKFHLNGRRLDTTYRMNRTRSERGKDEWLLFLSKDDRPEPEPIPSLAPMLATLVGAAFDDPDWVFEPKWDGVRAAAVCDRSTKLVSRNARDITIPYPELHQIHRQLVALDAVLDGEIVAFDQGIPSFERLQSRIHVRGEGDIKRLMKTTPVAYIVFDILYLDGRDLTTEPWVKRRELLERTVVPTDRVQVSPAIDGEGLTLFEAARAQALEGIIAKRRDSRYEIGRRSKSWLKIKTTFEADVVIAGWSEGEGRRSGQLGSIVLAVYDDDGALRYIGGVGTGFTEKTLDIVARKLKPLATDDVPFDSETLKGKPELRRAHWVRPELVAMIEFRQLTWAGKLRAPSFKGLRTDKEPRECTYEELRRSAQGDA